MNWAKANCSCFAKPTVIESEPTPRKPPVAKLAATPGERRKTLWLQVLTLLGATLVLCMAFVLNTPGSGRENDVYLPYFNAPIPETCATKKWLGIECPGCGLTRSFISIADGDFSRAWLFNPTGFLIFALVAAQIPFRSYQIWRLTSGQSLAYFPFSQPLILSIAGVVMLQWIARLLGWL